MVLENWTVRVTTQIVGIAYQGTELLGCVLTSADTTAPGGGGDEVSNKYPVDVIHQTQRDESVRGWGIELIDDKKTLSRTMTYTFFFGRQYYQP